MVDREMRHMQVAGQPDKSKISAVDGLKSGVGQGEIGMWEENRLAPAFACEESSESRRYMERYVL